MTSIVSLNGNEAAHAASETTVGIINYRVDETQVWADRVAQAWRESVAGIINVGRELLAAQSALKPKRGEWGRLFRGHENHVPNPVPFSLSMAERLMKIAEHPVLSNSAHGPNLPAAWRTREGAGRDRGDVERASPSSTATPIPSIS